MSRIRWKDLPPEPQKPPEDLPQRLAGLELALNQSIIGQPVAMRRLCAAVKKSFSGLARPDRPRHVFAFFGSTGVGKTFTARALAEAMYGVPEALRRLDMSEFRGSDPVSRLIGPPPGYLGYQEGSTFVSALQRQPFSVVLLDEAEKADPEVLDLFLQIFDQGLFTGPGGRSIDARQAIFILTSNLFTIQEVASLEEHDLHAETTRQQLTGIFRPEFVNRIDDILLFRSLSTPDLARIAAVEIQAINARLAVRHIAIQASPQSLDWLASQSLDPNSGARAVQRMVSRLVTEPISQGLLSGELRDGQTIYLDVIGNRFILKIESNHL